MKRLYEFFSELVQYNARTFHESQFLAHHRSAAENMFITESFQESYRLSCVCLDFIWERLHSGHWNKIELFWREGYSFFSALAAVSLFNSKGNILECLKLIDYGLIMGIDINSILTRLAQNLHDELSTSSSIQNWVLEIDTAFEQQDACIPFDTETISTHAEPDCELFLQAIGKELPFKIEGGINHWAATKNWSTIYILKQCAYRHVPVEIGSKYSDETWSQEIMPIYKFVQTYFDPKQSTKGYLAQHDFLGQVPLLKEEIMVPDYCFMTPELEEEQEKGEVVINSWFGPAGTVSPLHQDPRRNLLCQVFGRKLLILIPASDSAFVYPASEDPLLLNTSQVDVENVDNEKFPLFEKANQITAILNPGDMIYIPPKCWHFVKSLDPSFSVSFWFD